eukprot:603041-Pyramimonas_sp.AAC.1
MALGTGADALGGSAASEWGGTRNPHALPRRPTDAAEGAWTGWDDRRAYRPAPCDPVPTGTCASGSDPDRDQRS